MADSDMLKLYEKIGAMDAKITAAHGRIDHVVSEIKQDILELSGSVKALIEKKELDQAQTQDDIKELTAYMNRGKGWAAAGLLIAGAVGGLVTKGLGFLANKQ